MNGGLLVCRNQKWQVATIRDAGEKCTKAELYNEYVLNLCENENYWKIIKHKNYNPRIIEYITKINTI